jgi:hypothetical protein
MSPGFRKESIASRASLSDPSLFVATAPSIYNNSLPVFAYNIMGMPASSAQKIFSGATQR